MMQNSTFNLYSQLISFFSYRVINNNDNNRVINNNDNNRVINNNDNKSNELVTAIKQVKKPYRVSTTPYKDALMKGLKPKYKYLNRDYHYYQKLGNKINEIVDKRCKKRSHRLWWVDDYLRESYIKKNRMLSRNEYCVIIAKNNKSVKLSKKIQ